MSQPVIPSSVAVLRVPVSSTALPLPTSTRGSPVRAEPLLAGKPGKPLTDTEDGTEVQLNGVPTDSTQLLAQASGLPSSSRGTSTADACPIVQPGVADACGLAGAADAAPAGGLGWLSLLALGGLGGGGGGGKESPPEPYVLTPTVTRINNTVDASGDTGRQLLDLGADRSGAVYKVTAVVNNASGAAVNVAAVVAEGTRPYDATLYAATDPAVNPWFYLDTTTGIVSLTAAGAAAQCIGSSFTLSLQATASGVSSDVARLIFTVTGPGPEAGNSYNLLGSATNGLAILDANTDFDVLMVYQGNNAFTSMQVMPAFHGVNVLPSSLYLQVGNNLAEVQGHFFSDPSSGTSGALEYIAFVDAGAYYSYNFGTAAGLSYYKVSTTESTAQRPIVDGTDCADLLFGSTAADGHNEVFNAGAGNDLVFADPLFSGSPGNWTAVPQGLADVAHGEAGNDLLVGGGWIDYLFGDEGNDVLVGGYGMDQLTGGEGNDVFVFNAPAGAANADIIFDFAVGNDKIFLAKEVFGTDALTGGHVAYSVSSGELTFNGQVFATLANAPLLFMVNQTNFIVA